jgi:hypothetical protein
MCNSVELHYPQMTTGRLGYGHRCVGRWHVVCAWLVADDRFPLAALLIEIQMYYIGAL